MTWVISQWTTERVGILKRLCEWGIGMKDIHRILNEHSGYPVSRLEIQYKAHALRIRIPIPSQSDDKKRSRARLTLPPVATEVAVVSAPKTPVPKLPPTPELPVPVPVPPAVAIEEPEPLPEIVAAPVVEAVPFGSANSGHRKRPRSTSNGLAIANPFKTSWDPVFVEKDVVEKWARQNNIVGPLSVVNAKRADAGLPPFKLGGWRDDQFTHRSLGQSSLGEPFW